MLYDITNLILYLGEIDFESLKNPTTSLDSLR